MATLEDVRKAIEAAIGNLTPAKAQELAKSLSDPGAAKEQVAKMATDMVEWSQHNRDRMKEFVSREIMSQLRSMGLATQSELDALKKRVRELERRAGTGASGGAAPKKTGAKKSTAKRTGAKASGRGSSSTKSTAAKRAASAAS